MKLYADEEHHAEVRALADSSGFVVSLLARVEVAAAIWRKVRMGDLRAGSAAVRVAAFEADFFGAESFPSRFAVVGLGTAVLDDAARMVGTHGLRAYDAMQLAAARAAAADPDLRTFAAFDHTLSRAAAVEGFTLP